MSHFYSLGLKCAQKVKKYPTTIGPAAQNDTHPFDRCLVIKISVLVPKVQSVPGKDLIYKPDDVSVSEHFSLLDTSHRCSPSLTWVKIKHFIS